MKKTLEIISAVIMGFGLLAAISILEMANGVPQQLTSLIPIVGTYVLGRAIENLAK